MGFECVGISDWLQDSGINLPMWKIMDCEYHILGMSKPYKYLLDFLKTCKNIASFLEGSAFCDSTFGNKDETFKAFETLAERKWTKGQDSVSS